MSNRRAVRRIWSRLISESRRSYLATVDGPVRSDPAGGSSRPVSWSSVKLPPPTLISPLTSVQQRQRRPCPVRRPSVAHPRAGPSTVVVGRPFVSVQAVGAHLSLIYAAESERSADVYVPSAGTMHHPACVGPLRTLTSPLAGRAASWI